MPTLTLPDLSNIERPNLDDMPKIDVAKTVAEAATAVGLVQKRPSRWPFVIGVGLALAVVSWAWLNGEMLRERLSGAAGWFGDRVGAIRSDRVPDESIAFTAAEPAPSANDYPNGFGAPADMDGATGDEVLALDEVAARS